ncbi:MULTISPECIES: DUF7504 family protein [Halorussus]|uniref:DUF7504 family protein n=1 Tax=Halorussus TaxID=1070314 RepID=UPI00209F5D5E|nr:hypothetical protein [Halorussus vallis]USZ76132.1 hypothetical protein NGM07_02115 [Halorussus vallis]
MSGEEGRGSPESIVQFRNQLAELKQEGSNILLVGTDEQSAACERLLGESSARPRRRVFVTTDADPSVTRPKFESIDERPTRESAAVVDWRVETRSASADSGSGGDVRTWSVDGDLRTLGETVEQVVEAFDEETGGLRPAELRLCFDSLTPLVADRDLRDASRFLLALTETVKRVDGMAHYHLPVSYDDETVQVLAPLFDAVVEVQRGEREVEQRWHLSDPDITTDWLPL